MKRGINQCLWSCLSITLHNEMNKVCVGCETIIFSERNDAYKSMIDFCIEFSPKIPREEIFVVTAYGFVTYDCATNILVLPNAHFMVDQYHFLKSLNETFGSICDSISSDLRAITCSKSEA